jgi:hypothetical protein
MKFVPPKKFFTLALVTGIVIPTSMMIGSYVRYLYDSQTQASRVAPTVLEASDKSQAPLATISPTPNPTAVADTPKPTISTTMAIRCNVGGVDYQMSQSECDSAQWLHRRNDERWQSQPKDQELITLDHKVSPPPTGTPLLPTPTPVTCDFAAKATIDAQYQRDASSLYNDYQNALSRIRMSGVVDSSALQMAHSAYSSEKSRLDRQYETKLSLIHCP